MGLSNFVSGSTVSLIQDCYVASSVPGRSIEEYIGLVEFIIKNIDLGVALVNGEVFQSLVEAAKQHGANAVINARIATGSSMQMGHGLETTYLVAYGDAVVLS